MTKTFRLFWFAFLLVGFAFLHFDKLGKIPLNVHAWTQSDRIALSYCYADNGLKLFYPCTYNLATTEGITGGDLPIIEYLAAIPMRLFNFKSPLPLQLLQLLLFILAFFSMRRLAQAFNIDEKGVEVLAAFFLFTPVLSYYASGALPSISGLSLFIIGLHFFVKYLNESRNSDLLLFTLSFALTCLIRTPYVLHIAALLSFLFYRILVQKKTQSSAVWLVLFVPISYVAWYFWSKHLSATYGSAFLQVFMPASNFEHFVELLQESFAQWKFSYLSGIQYAFLLMLLMANVWQGRGFRSRLPEFGLLTKLLFISGIVYLLMMTRQFVNHDYYMIDALFPALFLSMLNIYPVFRKDFPGLKKWFGIIGLLAVVLWIFNSKAELNKRHETGFWNRISSSYENFEGSKQIIDKHIPTEAAVLVPDAYTSNIPLMQIQRKAYTTINTNDSSMNSILTKDVDYMLVQDQYFLSDVYPYAKGMSLQFQFKEGNGDISLYIRKNSTQSLRQFLGMQKAKEIQASLLNFLQKGKGKLIQEASKIHLIASDEYAFNFKLQHSRLWLSYEPSIAESPDLYWVLNYQGRSKYFPVDFKNGNLISIKKQQDVFMELYLWNPSKIKIDITIDEAYIL